MALRLYGKRDPAPGSFRRLTVELSCFLRVSCVHVSPAWNNTGILDSEGGWDSVRGHLCVCKWHCTLASINKWQPPVLRVLKNNSESSGSLARR